MNAMVKGGDLVAACQVFDEMFAIGVVPSGMCCNIMIDELFKSGDYGRAKRAEDGGVELDVICFNGVWVGQQGRGGRVDEAVGLISIMEKRDIGQCPRSNQRVRVHTATHKKRKKRRKRRERTIEPLNSPKPHPSITSDGKENIAELPFKKQSSGNKASPTPNPSKKHLLSSKAPAEHHETETKLPHQTTSPSPATMDMSNLLTKAKNLSIQNGKYKLKIRPTAPKKNAPYLLVGKCIGSHEMTLGAVIGATNKAWNHLGAVDVQKLQKHPRFFVITMQNEAQRSFAWEYQPYTIQNSLLTLRKWNGTGEPEKLDFDAIPLWVDFHSVPSEYKNEQDMKVMANHFFEVFQIDFEGINPDRWRPVVRVFAKVDITKPLLEDFELSDPEDNTIKIKLQYERIQEHCRFCGKISHLFEKCSDRNDWIIRGEPFPAKGFFRQSVKAGVASDPESSESEKEEGIGATDSIGTEDTTNRLHKSPGENSERPNLGGGLLCSPESDNTTSRSTPLSRFLSPAGTISKRNAATPTATFQSVERSGHDSQRSGSGIATTTVTSPNQRSSQEATTPSSTEISFLSTPHTALITQINPSTAATLPMIANRLVSPFDY
ncbi:hypothetical protein LINPERHAP2_LOCUS13041 [Linum perenne]